MVHKKTEQITHEIVFNLKVVKDFGEFPKGKNYLFSRYKGLGLVDMGYKTAKTGQRVMDKVRLTKQGRKLASLEM
jgi:hypothetical protein